MVYTREKIKSVQEALLDAKLIAVIGHKSPDGDAVGSCLALANYLNLNHPEVEVCMPDSHPHFFNWLTGADEIMNLNDHPEKTMEVIKEADVIFCLDFNALNRLGDKMEVLVKKSQGFKVMIDHHLYPSDEFHVSFSDTSACATAQMVYDFIIAMGHKKYLHQSIGEAIYCGIMTDSGSFRYPAVSAHTHEVIAEILKLGVSHEHIHERVFDTNTLSRLKLRGYATNEKMEILPEYATAIISLTTAELKKFNYIHGDTDGLVNIGLSINGINKSIFFKESDGIIKISFRSKGVDNPINELASTHFNGGGHANAAGGRWEGKLEDAIEKLKNVLPEFS